MGEKRLVFLPLVVCACFCQCFFENCLFLCFLVLVIVVFCGLGVCGCVSNMFMWGCNGVWGVGCA